jgi:hypothetical protein
MLGRSGSAAAVGTLPRVASTTAVITHAAHMPPGVSRLRRMAFSPGVDVAKAPVAAVVRRL